jgi:hypothetical protein
MGTPGRQTLTPGLVYSVISYTGPHTLCIAAEDVAEEELQGSPAGAGQHWGAAGGAGSPAPVPVTAGRSSPAEWR